jgi:major capsid protein Gp23
MKTKQNVLKTKIHEKWIPKLEEHFKDNDVNLTDEKKLKKIAEMCHTRKIREGIGGGSAVPGGVPGRGVMDLGNNPGVAGDNSLGSGEIFQNLFSVFVDTAAENFALDLLPIITMQKSNLTVAVTEPIYADGSLDKASNKPPIFKCQIEDNGGATPLVVGTTYTLITVYSTGDETLDLKYIGMDQLDGAAIFEITKEWGTYVDSTVKECVTVGAIREGAAISWDFDEDTVDYVNSFRNPIGGYAGAGHDNDQNLYVGRQTGVTPGNSPMERRVGETTMHRSMGLSNWSENFAAKTYKVDIEYTQEQIDDLKMDHDVDAAELGTIAMQKQLSQAIDDHVLGTVFANGWSHHKILNTLSGFNMNAMLGTGTGGGATYYGKDNTPLTIGGTPSVIPTTGAIQENLSSMQRRVISRATYGATVVKNKSKQGRGNMSVLNGTFSAAMQDIRGYKESEFENDIDDSGLFQMGSFNKISLYEDGMMDLDDMRIAVFRKGTENDSGLKFLSYLLAQKTSTLAEATGSLKEYLHSRYNIATVGKSSHTNYIVFNIEQGTYKIV